MDIAWQVMLGGSTCTVHARARFGPKPGTMVHTQKAVNILFMGTFAAYATVPNNFATYNGFVEGLGAIFCC